VANIIPSNYSQSEQETLKRYGFNWRCALWKKSLMTDTRGNPYRDSNGNIIQIPIVGYVVTNVQRPMPAPTGVNAYLSGNGYQVTVDWIPTSNGVDTLLGYYIYRSCDNQDPVQVNTTMLSPTDSSFVDSATLKPGKIYTYYVVTHYAAGSSQYSTMNPKSSTVVWGIPTVSENIPNDVTDDTSESSGKHAASILSGGSLAMIVAMLALLVSAAACGMIAASKKKNFSVESDNEE
jgi:hypothetical protein